MSTMSVNMSPVGLLCATGFGRFGPETPRGVLADAFEEEGDGEGAALLRSVWPLVAAVPDGFRPAYPLAWRLLVESHADPLGAWTVIALRTPEPLTLPNLDHWLHHDWVARVSPVPPEVLADTAHVRVEFERPWHARRHGRVPGWRVAVVPGRARPPTRWRPVDLQVLTPGAPPWPT